MDAPRAQEAPSEPRQSPGEALAPPPPPWARAAVAIAWLLVALFAFARVVDLQADFTAEREYSRDGVLYTDEGWYAANALAWHRLGHWHLPGDLNFAVNLPVLQLMHAAVFSLFGAGIGAARMTIVLSWLAMAVLMWRLLRAWAGPAAALAGLLVFSTNYFAFLFSRLALAEFPMAMWALAAIGAALGTQGGCAVTPHHRQATAAATLWRAALPGVLFALAFYTKTNALFALPILVAILAWRHWPDARMRLLAPGAMLAAFAAGVGLHTVLLAIPYAEDYTYFYRLNIGIHGGFDPMAVAKFALHVADHVRLVDKVLYRALIAAVPLMMWLSPWFRRNPLVWVCLAWFAVYLAQISLYQNFKPRYWVCLAAPMAMLAALCLRAAWTLEHPRAWARPVLAWAMALAIAASAARNARDIFRYLGDAQYTFHNMAIDIKKRLDAEPDARNLLLGHFSATVALHAEVRWMNDRYATQPLAERLRRERPLFLLTESTLYARDYGDEHTTLPARAGGRRLPALAQLYAGLDGPEDAPPLVQYNVLGNYQGWPVSLYRLEPSVQGLPQHGDSPN